MSGGKTIRIALAGNPNSGKTTLFNALTGSNQFVGNWPGVTVEKKEGGLKKHDDVIITDLPGIYSLSPYSLEEVVARSYLLDEEPEAILNIVDGTNLERNLYLTTQLAELGIPMVVAINMMDVVRKNGDRIDIETLSKAIGCPVVEISALKNEGTVEAAEAAIAASKQGRVMPMHTFSGPAEHAIAHIEEAVLHDMPSEKQRWYAIKIFERDEKVLQKLQIPEKTLKHIEEDIAAAEKELSDDSEAIIISERYGSIADIVKKCLHRKNAGGLTTSDKVDRIVTSRWFGLPILAAVMFLIYYISMVTVGQMATDWANEGVFGDGFHLFGVGSSAYEQDSEKFTAAKNAVAAFVPKDLAAKLSGESEDFNAGNASMLLRNFVKSVPEEKTAKIKVTSKEDLSSEEIEFTGENLAEAVPVMEKFAFRAPDPARYGWWVPGVPRVTESLLDRMKCAPWLKGLILDGIVAGVGSVLGFVPQMLVLFLLLAWVEACGYMARIAFVLDRLFRRFGLSGKSFIPILVGTGCGVPGIMASRTIENERERRMTIITTTFIPCSAKTPFIALIAGAIFGGSPWIATSAYFLGMASIIISGLMLKKLRMFSGLPSPFVMELPPYHLPTLGNVLRPMWDNGWSFIKRAGTVILLSTVFVWFASRFGFVDGSFRMLAEDRLDLSLLARIGDAFSWIFIPLGWGTWQAAVASFCGLIAKENIVGTLGVLYQSGAADSVYGNLALVFSPLAGYTFLVFNLLCAPCFAALGAIRREMNSAKWFWFTVIYQCTFAYVIALLIYQTGCLLQGRGNAVGVTAAALLAAGMIFQLVRPDKNA
ncbi:MAG: ferrous iron transporter B [Lentisphaeria bacterium]|nr:ferrous iron transporter B [Lentisphaeria bacterium]